MKLAQSLNIFCLRGDGVWRLHALREELPPRLRDAFDEHGEAVAVGIMGAAHLSQHRLGFEGLARIEACLGLHSLPVAAPSIERKAVIELLELDKKKDESGLRMVLLTDIGRPVLARVDRLEVAAALDAIGVDS